MQFKYIHIKNLFGLYNYNIDFFHEDENKLTILTAPNGYGKTTVLTILDSLSPESLYYFYLLKIPDYFGQWRYAGRKSFIKWRTK